MKLQFLCALLTFGFSATGTALLLISTVIIWRKFGFRARKFPVTVDLSALIVDRLVLNGCLSVLLLLETATVLWDTVSTRQFPLVVRWPALVFIVIGVWFSGSRLFRLYLETARRQAINEEGPSDVTDDPCLQMKEDKQVE